MVRSIFLFFIMQPMFYVFGQESDSLVNNSIKYYGKDYFLIEGSRFAVAEKENAFDRLPASYKNKVRPEVWSLSRNSAGLSIRFSTNSPVIKVKWVVLNNVIMPHMTETGIKGMDLYCRQNKTWQYVGTAIPQGKINEAFIAQNMSEKWREYKLFLPLYDGVLTLEIGIDSRSEIQIPDKNTKKPIVFYGTSITQGGCASRPGMAHTNIISRKLDIECINFGFSGNGRMEREVAEAISEIDAAFYVIDCIPNMEPEDIRANVWILVAILREKRPDTPIIFVESITYESSFFDEKKRHEVTNRNEAMKNEYKKILAAGIKQVYYIECNNCIGSDHEATVDGVHFTDLGFIRFSEYLMKKFKEYKLYSV